jgi:spore coat protein U-like protein
VRVNIELRVENDCIIQAPQLDFGTAPLAGSFNPVTRTIQIRCSARRRLYGGARQRQPPSRVAVRRMANGSNYLAYEIYKSAVSPDRWGMLGAGSGAPARAADLNPGVYNSLTNQSYTYRAVIDPAQTTPPAGNYSDTVRIDVEF